MPQNFWLAFAFALFAGLSTGIGGIIAIFNRSSSHQFLSISLGFSAGVMIYISFVELLAQAISDLSHIEGKVLGMFYANIAFFAGMGAIALIDYLVPSFENPHEIPEGDTNPEKQPAVSEARVLRMGILTLLAIAVHNFPEGVATLVAGLKDIELGISIAIAIAIHNIPEGVAIAVPIYMTTRSRTKAIGAALVAGICEPVGALVGYTFLMPFWNEYMTGIIFAATAGVMVFVSLDQLLPHAERYGHHHEAIYGLVGGMAVMAASLIFLA